MTDILPWVALALAAASLIARDGSRTTDPRAEGPTDFWLSLRSHVPLFVALGVLGGLFLVLGWRWNDPLEGALWAGAGMLAGLALAAAAHMAEMAQPRSFGGPVAPMALALTAVALTTYGQKAPPIELQLAMVAGAALGAWLASVRSEGSGADWASIAASFAGIVVAANFLGAKLGDKTGETGTTLGLVIGLSGIAAAGLAKAIQRQRGETEARAGIFVTIAVLLVLLGGSLIAKRYLYVHDAWLIFGGSALAALIVNWILPDEGPTDAFRFLIAAVIWIAIATIAFGLRKGYGMSITVLGGAGMMLLLGNRRALLTFGPVLALVMLRVFRELYPESYRALDIGQHYAIIGLLLGAALPMLPVEWSRVLGFASVRASLLVAGVLWIILLIGLQPAAAVLLGAKGVVGFMVGLGFGTLIEGARGGRSLQVLSLSAGLAATGAVAFAWLDEHLTKARDEKLGVFYGVVAGLVVVALVIAILTPSESQRSRA